MCVKNFYKIKKNFFCLVKLVLKKYIDGKRLNPTMWLTIRLAHYVVRPPELASPAVRHHYI
jgi:hypothetical protein